MKTNTPTSEGQSTLRHQIETIILAACRIKAIREPDTKQIDSIVAETIESVGERSLAKLEDVVVPVVERLGIKIP